MLATLAGSRARIWTTDQLDELARDFTGHPDLTKGQRFLDKLHDRLANVSPGAGQLMAGPAGTVAGRVRERGSLRLGGRARACPAGPLSGMRPVIGNAGAGERGAGLDQRERDLAVLRVLAVADAELDSAAGSPSRGSRSGRARRSSPARAAAG